MTSPKRTSFPGWLWLFAMCGAASGCATSSAASADPSDASTSVPPPSDASLDARSVGAMDAMLRGDDAREAASSPRDAREVDASTADASDALTGNLEDVTDASDVADAFDAANPLEGVHASDATRALDADSPGSPVADALEADDATTDVAPMQAADAPDPAPLDADVVDAASCRHCVSYGTPAATAVIPSELPELSGLAASRRHPGRLYAHNDSGDAARVFAFAQEGTATVAELRLDGVLANDWEDVAVGPCDAGSCVFVGDIGDNNLVRSEYALYRLAEPNELAPGSSTQTVAYQRFAFVYPDGPHNAETLLVHPGTGRVYIVTKAVEGQQVYELPLPLDPGTTAIAARSTLVARLPTAPVTAGTFHPCGDRLLLRTYASVFEYRASAAPANASAVFGEEPGMVPVAPEQQGEAITYRADGLGYVTASESPSAATRASLNVVGCL